MAIERLRAICDIDAGYRDASAKLQEAIRQKPLADLYAEARRHHQAQAWQTVVRVFGRIKALDVAYPDPERLLASAYEQITAQEREQRLKMLYSYL